MIRINLFHNYFKITTFYKIIYNIIYYITKRRNVCLIILTNIFLWKEVNSIQCEFNESCFHFYLLPGIPVCIRRLY